MALFVLTNLESDLKRNSHCNIFLESLSKIYIYKRKQNIEFGEYI